MGGYLFVYRGWVGDWSSLEMTAPLQRSYTVTYLVLLFIFGCVELNAIRDPKHGDTFSEHVWAWADIYRTAGVWGWIRRFLLIGVLGWLGIHFLSGGAM